MTAFDYASTAASATSLLTRFGTALQLKRTTPGTYDPITGTETGASTTYASTIGVFSKISTSYALTNEVQTGDRMVIMDASVAPQLTDRLVVGASELAIINVVPIDPAGVAVAYKLQIRGQVDDSADGSAFGPTPASRTLDGGTF